MTRHCFGLPMCVASLLLSLSATNAGPSPIPTLLPTFLPTNERAALSMLYLSTKGKSDWGTRTNWMDESKRVSEWYGIATANDGSVSSVNMYANKLNGSLPTEIGLLAKAVSFKLQHNSISSSIPTQLGQLVDLEGFGLNDNSMSSSIPTEVGKLVKAARLFLNSNFLSSSIPTQIGQLVNAEIVKVKENDLSSSIPTQIGHLVNVTDLHLEHNHISSSIPSQVGELVSIVKFGLNSNNISSSIPTELGNLENAVSFNPAFNSITSSIPTELGKLTKVSYFDMDTNDITSSIPTELGELTEVLYFDLDTNDISLSIPTELAQLVELTYFDVYHNSISSTVPTEYGKLVKAATFDLGVNNMSSTIPSELSHLRAVEYFDLGYNSFHNSIPTELGHLKSVDQFILNYNSVTGSIPTQLGRLKMNGGSFRIQHNSIKGEIPTQLGWLVAVEHLYVKENGLSLSLPTQLGALSAMKVFQIQTNQVMDKLPTEIGSLTSAVNIIAESNAIGGSIPTEIGSIGRSLEVLSLGNQSLSSTLPHTMCNLSGLVMISLSNNSLSGEFPACLSGFPNLKVLNVARNQMSGPLPSLKRWPGISYLLLHQNKFSGGIGALEFNQSQHHEVTTHYIIDDFYDDDDDDDGDYYYYGNYGYYDDYNGQKSIQIDDYGSNLVALTVHGNALTGEIPQDLMFPPSLETFTVADNQIEGRVPSSMLKLVKSSQSSPLTIYATNNRLSCDLPRSWDFNSSKQSLVMIGNAFSRPVAKWVNPIERKSSSLSTVERIEWRRGMVPLWLQLLLITASVTLVSAPLIARYRRDVANSNFQSSMGRALFACSRGVTAFAVFSLLSLVLFPFGAHYYTCGGSFIKYATAAYMADAPTIEMILACACCLWTVGLACVLRRFSPAGEEIQAKSRPISTEIRADWSRRRSRTERFLGHARAALFVLAWFVTLVGAGGIPTGLYVLTYSLPHDNKLAILGHHAHILNHLLAFYLSVVSGRLIPFLTKPTALAILKHGYNRRDLDRESGKAKLHEVEVVLGIISRTLIVVILPVTSVLYFDNGCFANWTKIWSPCDIGKSHFSKTSSIDFTLHFVPRDLALSSNLTSTTVYQDRSSNIINGTIDLEILSRDAVCKTSFHFGKCSRDLLEILCPLFISKLLYAILLAALQPITTFVLRKVALWLNEWRRRRFAACVWWPFGSSLAAASETASTAASSERQEEGGGQNAASKNNVSLLEEPDPMMVLIWYETAFIFGCLSPLLVVLLAVQLFVDATIFEWTLRRAPSANHSGALPLPILRQPLKLHLNLVLALHIIMVIFFYFDNDFAGWKLVAALLPLVLVVSVALDIQEELRISHAHEERDPEGRGNSLSIQMSAESSHRSEMDSVDMRERGLTAGQVRERGFTDNPMRERGLTAGQVRERGLTDNPMALRGGAVLNPLSLPHLSQVEVTEAATGGATAPPADGDVGDESN